MRLLKRNQLPKRSGKRPQKGLFENCNYQKMSMLYKLLCSGERYGIYKWRKTAVESSLGFLYTDTELKGI
jgi:hypothetical protein